MRKGRMVWISLAALAIAVAAALALYFLVVRPALAKEFEFTDTTLPDFNAGYLYHTALAQEGDGEVTLLPIGLGQPWITTTALPAPRSGHAAAYDDWHIYVIGGDDGSELFHNDIYYTTIDTATHELDPWITTTPLPTSAYPEGLYFHEAAVLNGYIYVFGGKEDAGAESTYYDTVVYASIQPDGTLGDWQEATADLPLALFGLECVVVHDRIYVVGGATTLGQSNPAVYFTTPESWGDITGWTAAAPLPDLPVGGYIHSSVTVEHDRIYIYGGASSVAYADYSPYVYFGEPLTTTGDISDWVYVTEPLPQNCYASEGAAYQSGLLLAITGAWNNAYDPSGDVRAALVYHESGQTGEWVSTIGLNPGRFYHTVVQDDLGWLFSIGGQTGALGGYLREVQVAPPYGGGGGGGELRGTDVRLYHTQEASRTIYAPDGTFTSRRWPVSVIEGEEASLTRLRWNTTITDPVVMTITVAYRYRHEYVWTDWFGPYPSSSGISATTSLPISGTCDLFEYRVYFTTTISTTTPILNWVKIGVLAPPDLTADELTVTGCGTCPGLIPPGEPVQIEFTVFNDSTRPELDNNFFAMVFITTTPDYMPNPPDLPIGCEGYNPPTKTCPLIWPLQAVHFGEGDPPVVLTTTWTFESAGRYYLVACIDYNDTPSHPPPYYDVVEIQEYNNCLTFATTVVFRPIYLPFIVKNWP